VGNLTRKQSLLLLENRAIQKASRGAGIPNRRRCFISYHIDDQAEVNDFVDQFGEYFIFTCLGVTDEDNFVDSVDEDTIKRVIRDNHLRTTTVTIVLVGKCTKNRKFVDWEISSSLRDDPRNKRSGIVAIPLPSLNNTWNLPQRLSDNYDRTNSSKSYVVGLPYPATVQQLRGYVERAIENRDQLSKLVVNSRPLMRFNTQC
jgi:hypothetical protein